MTNALFSPRSEEIHRSEIGEILLSQMIERGDFKQVKRGVCRMRGAGERSEHDQRTHPLYAFGVCHRLRRVHGGLVRPAHGGGKT